MSLNPNLNPKQDPDDRYNISKNAIKIGNVHAAFIENFRKNVKYWMLFFYVILIMLVFYTAAKNPGSLFSQQYVYIATIVIPLLVMVYFYFNGDQFITSQNMRIAAIAGVVVLVIYAITYYALPRGLGFQVFTAYGFNLLLLLIVVVGFAIIFNVFRNATRKLTGWTGFIFRFLFFIPCLLSDFFDYLKMEYKTTPPTVFILFIAEIALILAYIYLPSFLNNHLTKNSITIQNSPIRLDVVTVLDNNSMFRLKPRDVLHPNKLPQDTKMLLGDQTNVNTSILDASGDILLYANNSTNPPPADLFTTNFGLSMWIYVNEKDIGVNDPTHMAKKEKEITKKVPFFSGWMTTTTKETVVEEVKQQEIPIFKYGNTNDGNLGKPSISYIGNSKWKFNFTVPSKKPSVEQYQDTYFILPVPSQKWNQVVFNYYDNKVDLWINGNLERNMDLHSIPIQQTQTDTITIGNKWGLMGAICNIQFYSKPMTSSQISQAYNLLYSQNPPVK